MRKISISVRSTAITVYIFATAVDYLSTLPVMQYEENPVARYFIERSGAVGLFVFDVVIILFVIGIIQLTDIIVTDERLKKVIYLSLIALSLFKVLIALTNFGIAPYWMTAWLVY